jgi:hypothetical protein
MNKDIQGIGVFLMSILALSGAATATVDTTTTTATMSDHIWISSSADVNLELVPDSIVETPSTVSVKTNKNHDWTVTASLDKAGGLLTESTSETQLTMPLVLMVGSTDYSLDTTQTIYDDSEPDHKTGGTPRDINPTFKQESVYADGPGTYTGIVTFTAEYKP